METGREYLLQDVQSAFYDVVLGKSVAEATVIETAVDDDGEEKVVKRTTTTRKAPPNVNALIFLSKNMNRYHPVTNPEGWLSEPAATVQKEIEFMMASSMRTPEVYANVAKGMAALPERAGEASHKAKRSEQDDES